MSTNTITSTHRLSVLAALDGASAAGAAGFAGTSATSDVHGGGDRKDGEGKGCKGSELGEEHFCSREDCEWERLVSREGWSAWGATLDRCSPFIHSWGVHNWARPRTRRGLSGLRSYTRREARRRQSDVLPSSRTMPCGVLVKDVMQRAAPVPGEADVR